LQAAAARNARWSASASQRSKIARSPDRQIVSRLRTAGQMIGDSKLGEGGQEMGGNELVDVLEQSHLGREGPVGRAQQRPPQPHRAAYGESGRYSPLRRPLEPSSPVASRRNRLIRHGRPLLCVVAGPWVFLSDGADWLRR